MPFLWSATMIHPAIHLRLRNNNKEKKLSFFHNQHQYVQPRMEPIWLKTLFSTEWWWSSAASRRAAMERSWTKLPSGWCMETYLYTHFQSSHWFWICSIKHGFKTVNKYKKNIRNLNLCKFFVVFSGSIPIRPPKKEQSAWLSDFRKGHSQAAPNIGIKQNMFQRRSKDLSWGSRKYTQGFEGIIPYQQPLGAIFCVSFVVFSWVLLQFSSNFLHFPWILFYFSIGFP